MNRERYMKINDYVEREEVEAYLSDIIMELNLRQLCDTDISINKTMLWVESISITNYEPAKQGKTNISKPKY
ncbi:hypothetical protein EHE19_018200 [Ruminiclostridium herbifermentans]|uniref:Uncharacterized protein n=2 Tax=Ruminiclostridium herbifermentans TaxID=2488810 RepID=A0A7H1VMY3_9FIRM|nr:hypothetical protein EHE19_018200 [Ruminiclostridium herbifermentans]